MSHTSAPFRLKDCVQEVWLRVRRLDAPATVRDLRAWLTTTIGRITALDVIRNPDELTTARR